MPEVDRCSAASSGIQESKENYRAERWRHSKEFLRCGHQKGPRRGPPAAATTLVAEWHQIKNGKISRVESAFDGRPFAAMFAGGKR